jgi:hypothetical protein
MLPPNPKVYCAQESNPLLKAEEIEFLEMATHIFSSGYDTRLSDTIQAVLDMRFRYPHMVAEMLKQGTLDPKNPYKPLFTQLP